MTDQLPPFSKNDVKVLERKTDYDSFLQVDSLRLQYRLFEGGWSEPIARELLVKTPAVGVLLYDPDREELVMVKQFRVGMLDDEDSPWPLELVAGLVDTEESLEQVANREVMEETGLQASDFIKICDYYNSPGASSERVTLFCARVDATQAGGIHGLDHEHEDIQVEVLSTESARLAIESGVINNAMSLIALQWLFSHQESILAKWA
ncbi:MAG: NUDIX domain-containing protein [Pseudomonadales bacterium]|nr:NUDIX domain-containing protein [Pseudomonadales bacterium]